MTILQAFILGFFQGLTEFLPVSSSGHLVLIQNFFNLSKGMIAFDVAVHWGTLLAVLVYFFKDIARIVRDTFLFFVKLPFRRSLEKTFQEHPRALTGCFVLVSTVATGMMALAFREVFEKMFSSLIYVGIGWFLTGVFLLLSARFQHGVRGLQEMNHQDAFVIGLSQGIAIIPGVSRSGATILGGMMLGLDREAAARFSFLVGIPAILGAGILEMGNAVRMFTESPAVLVTGVLTSALVGFVSIIFLLRLVRSGKFYWFGFYCIALALFTFAYTLLRS
ncbi:MAG: undecaprenyl-diphosphate phosphatase [Candidatus Omnitrophota bacterium]|jgi:undecaprenyl-diphosphatase